MVFANSCYDVPGTLTGKELVIDFLSNRSPQTLSARAIVGSASALGFTEQSVRMALMRVVDDGLAITTGRGVYKLAPAGEVMRMEVRKWRNIAKFTQPWSGAWLSVYDASIARSDRAALRRHEQALRLRGFRELVSGLSIRPANLRYSVSDLREQLRALGLHSDAILITMSDLDGKTRTRAMHLWDTKTLLDSYQELTRAMNASTHRVESLPIEVAAGETLVLGRNVLRHLNLDPLLPAELMPERPLLDLIEIMIAYDDMARRIWRRFMSQFEA